MSFDKIVVSVCMITYNHEFYIRKAIEGVLMQKCNYLFNLVIGEDCSKDKTNEICTEYSKNYPSVIKLLSCEKNLGMMANFIRTLQACNGKYIAWCEGDDYWTDPYKLQKQIDFFEKNNEYSLVHSNYDHFDTTTGILIKNANNNNEYFYDKYNRSYASKEIFLDILFGRYFIRTCTAVFKRLDVLRIIKGTPELFTKKFLMADTQLFCELSQIGKIYYIEESTAVANKLLISAHHNPDPQKKILFAKSLGEMAIYLLRKHSFKEELIKAIRRQATFLLLNAIKFNQRIWVDETKVLYGDYLSNVHFYLILLSRTYITRKITLFFIKLFVWVPKAIVNRIRTKVKNYLIIN